METKQPKTKRATPLKKEILQLLEKNHFLTAPQILEKLHKKGLRVNKTSVYRNLDSFLEDDLICQQTFGDDEFVYELQKNHHDHLCCESCGKVEEVSCHVDVPKKIDGYVVNHHHLTMYGLCKDCQSLL